MNCPFCHPERNAIFYEDELTMGLWDAFPVSDGHALIITKRHISSWFDTTDEEKLALNRSTEQAKLIIEKKYTPDGFNIGMNINEQGGTPAHIFRINIGETQDHTCKPGMSMVPAAQTNIADGASLFIMGGMKRSDQATVASRSRC